MRKFKQCPLDRKLDATVANDVFTICEMYIYGSHMGTSLSYEIDVRKLHCRKFTPSLHTVVRFHSTEYRE